MLELLSEINKLEQVIMEDTYDRRKIRQHIRNQIGEDTPSFRTLLTKVENICINEELPISPTDLTIELMLTTLIVSRAPLQSIVSNLVINLDIEEDYLNSIDKLTTVIIDAAGIVYDVLHTQSDAYIVLPKVKLSKELEDYIACKKYLPPMSSTPKPWKSNVGGGYLTRTESCILGKLNHHNEKQALDVLNILQEIPLELDLEALSYEEESTKPLDTEEKKKNFNHMVEESDYVYEETLNRGNEFYFKWNFDMRGRMYSAGYHINIQGTPYKRSIINFKRKELIK